jgi:hypothetical protein
MVHRQIEKAAVAAYCEQASASGHRLARLRLSSTWTKSNDASRVVQKTGAVGYNVRSDGFDIEGAAVTHIWQQLVEASRVFLLFLGGITFDIRAQLKKNMVICEG